MRLVRAQGKADNTNNCRKLREFISSNYHVGSTTFLPHRVCTLHERRVEGNSSRQVTLYNSQSAGRKAGNPGQKEGCHAEYDA